MTSQYYVYASEVAAAADKATMDARWASLFGGSVWDVPRQRATGKWVMQKPDGERAAVGKGITATVEEYDPAWFPVPPGLLS